MTATWQNIVVEQRATFTFTALVYDSDGKTPKVLTGYTGQMQIRDGDGADAPLLATATVTIDAANGLVTATIAGSVTATYTWRAGRYDLVIFSSGGAPERVAEGNAKLTFGVTR